MWQVVDTNLYRIRRKRYAKKHGRELVAMLANFDTYLESLETGVHPLQIRHGFSHSEKSPLSK